MRHLVRYFLASGILLGCTVSEVGSMDPDPMGDPEGDPKDPVHGAECDTVETTIPGDCTRCTCDGQTWSCVDTCAPIDGGRCKTPKETRTFEGCYECTCQAHNLWSCVDTCDPVEGGRCLTPMETRTLDDDCTECTCQVQQTWSCDHTCDTTECAPGDTKLGEGGCYRCSCDDTGHWNCPDIVCEGCPLGETTTNPCFSCVCNERGTWSCSGFFDGNCADLTCTPGDMAGAHDGVSVCTCNVDGDWECGPPDPGIVCPAGYADCNGDNTDGCETNLSSSIYHCGTCGRICMAFPQEAAVCSAGQCLNPTAPVYCKYLGVDHAPGTSFPDRDGCNTCECVQAGTSVAIECTDEPCMCNPTNETYRDYYSNDTEECAPIVFECPSSTTVFENECGCGCEQGVECPETFVCTPEEQLSMRCDLMRITCPYTEIVDG